MIVQVDHPLHDFRGSRVWVGLRTDASYAEGYVGDYRFHLTGKDGKHYPTPQPTSFSFWPQGEPDQSIGFEVPDFETGLNVLRESAYYLDPAVCFIIARGGPAGLAEVLDRHV